MRLHSIDNEEEQIHLRPHLMVLTGVGPQRKKLLLKHFGSVKKIREASIAELQEAGLPARVAMAVEAHFRDETLQQKE